MKSLLKLPSFIALATISLLSACSNDDGASKADSIDTDSLLSTIAAMESTITLAEKEIERLRSIEDIENLISAYGYYVDKSMHDEVADLFSDDAVLEILGRGVFFGIDRIRGYMNNFGAVGPKDGSLFNHMQMQPIVTISDDGLSADARARLFVMFAAGTVAQMGEGTYENHFVKVDGIWKIQHLHGFQGHYTIYEDGWANKSSAIFAPYDRFPPDAPQSVEYDPYPAAFVIPFHYDNPVTGNTITNK